MLPNLDARQDLIGHMRSCDTAAVFHYLPLHLSVMGRRIHPAPPSLPVAESAADRLLRLPMYNDMTDVEVEVADVVAAITAWKPSA